MKLSLESVFGLVIGIIFVFIIGGVIVTLVKTQLPKEMDDVTMSSLEELVRFIESFEDDAEKKLPIDINEPFAIIGFSSGVYVLPVRTGSVDVISPFSSTDYTALKVRNLGSPCVGKTCLCVCPVTGGIMAEDNNCFKYKDKCKILKNVDNLIGSNTGGNIFALTTTYSGEPYEVSLIYDKAERKVTLRI